MRTKRVPCRAIAVATAILLGAVGAVVPAPLEAGAAIPTWTVESELPPNYAFFPSISCATVTVCVAVGFTAAGQSAIVGTTDGGAHWSTLYTAAPNVFLLRVLCVTPSTFVAVGLGTSTAEFLHSSDGGATWTSSSVPDSLNFLGSTVDLWCASAASCVLVAQSSASRLDELSTTDLGTTWNTHRATVPGWFDGEIACVARSECLTGIRIGNSEVNRMYRTINAGATWSLLPGVSWPGGPISVACTSQHRCVASAGSALGTASVYATASAGNRWSRVEKGANWDATTIRCDQSGLCAATWASDHGLSAPVVGISIDGGVTWRRSTLTGALGGGEDIACSTPTTCLATVYRFNPRTGPTSTLYATGDGGTTWSSVYAASGPTNLDSVACPSALSCLIVGDDASGAYVETSSDGGTTWTTTASVTGAGESLGSLTCVSMTDCLAVSLSQNASEVVRTSDLGTTWTAVALPAGSGAVFSVSCPTSTKCFALSETAMLVSSDGGVTWSTATLPASIASLVTVISATCATATTCFAVATYIGLPIILGSSDGGLTWSIAHKIVGSDLWFGDQLLCPSANHCLSIADASNLFQFNAHDVPFEYAYSGGTWAPRYEFGEQIFELAGVQCQSSGTCEGAANLVTGADSLLLTSSDYGLTWAPSSMPFSYVTTMTCASPTSCVAVGLDAAGGWTIARLA